MANKTFLSTDVSQWCHNAREHVYNRIEAIRLGEADRVYHADLHNLRRAEKSRMFRWFIMGSRLQTLLDNLQTVDELLNRQDREWMCDFVRWDINTLKERIGLIKKIERLANQQLERPIVLTDKDYALLYNNGGLDNDEG